MTPQVLIIFCKCQNVLKCQSPRSQLFLDRFEHIAVVEKMCSLFCSNNSYLHHPFTFEYQNMAMIMSIDKKIFSPSVSILVHVCIARQIGHCMGVTL